MGEYGNGTIEPFGKRFRARIYLGGRPKHVGMFATREDAESALRGFIALKAKQEIEDSSIPTLKAWGERWLDRRELEGKRSIDDDRNRWKKHVTRARFYNWPIDTIRRRDVSRWIDTLKATRASDKRGKRPLSWQVVKHCRTLLSGCLSAAVRDEIIERNPVSGIPLPRPDTSEPEWSYLLPDEQARLLDNRKIPEPERLIIGFAITTGLRQGEQWAIELRDLHVDGDDPHVFVRWGSPGLPPKNGKTRRVSLTVQGLAIAKRWLELLPSYLLRMNGCGSYPNEYGLVFPTLRGNRRREGKPPRAWSKYLELAGLHVAKDRHDGRGVRWHDLRHTCASSLIGGWWGRAWRLEEIREHLGHKSIKVTERYAHLATTVLAAAAAATPGPVALPTPPPVANDDPKTVQTPRNVALSEGSSSGLRSRRPQVRILCGAPTIPSASGAALETLGRSLDGLRNARDRFVRAVDSRNRFTTRYGLDLAAASSELIEAVEAALAGERRAGGAS